jgi:hypothetical protein
MNILKQIIGLIKGDLVIVNKSDLSEVVEDVFFFRLDDPFIDEKTIQPEIISALKLDHVLGSDDPLTRIKDYYPDFEGQI